MRIFTEVLFNHEKNIFRSIKIVPKFARPVYTTKILKQCPVHRTPHNSMSFVLEKSLHCSYLV